MSQGLSLIFFYDYIFFLSQCVDSKFVEVGVYCEFAEFIFYLFNQYIFIYMQLWLATCYGLALTCAVVVDIFLDFASRFDRFTLLLSRYRKAALTTFE